MFILQEILKYEHIGFLGFLKSRTEPDRTETGRFDSVSVWFRVFFFKKDRTGLVVFFSSKPNRTENAHPYFLDKRNYCPVALRSLDP